MRGPPSPPIQSASPSIPRSSRRATMPASPSTTSFSARIRKRVTGASIVARQRSRHAAVRRLATTPDVGGRATPRLRGLSREIVGDSRGYPRARGRDRALGIDFRRRRSERSRRRRLSRRAAAPLGRPRDRSGGLLRRAWCESALPAARPAGWRASSACTRSTSGSSRKKRSVKSGGRSRRAHLLDLRPDGEGRAGRSGVPAHRPLGILERRRPLRMGTPRRHHS